MIQLLIPNHFSWSHIKKACIQGQASFFKQLQEHLVGTFFFLLNSQGSKEYTRANPVHSKESQVVLTHWFYTIETNVNTVKKSKGYLRVATSQSSLSSPITALYCRLPKLSYLQDSLDYTVKINEQNDSYLNLLEYEDTNVSPLKAEAGGWQVWGKLGKNIKTFSQKQINCSKITPYKPLFIEVCFSRILSNAGE